MYAAVGVVGPQPQPQAQGDVVRFSADCAFCVQPAAPAEHAWRFRSVDRSYDGAADLGKTVGLIRSRLVSHLYTATGLTRIANAKLADLKGKVVVAFDPLFSQLFDPVLGIFPYKECGKPDGSVRVVQAGGLKVYDVYADSNSFADMKRDQNRKLDNHGGYGKSYLFLQSWTLTGQTGGILDLELLSRCANPQLPRNLRGLARQGTLPNIVHLDHLDAYLCGAIIALNDVAPAQPVAGQAAGSQAAVPA